MFRLLLTKLLVSVRDCSRLQKIFLNSYRLKTGGEDVSFPSEKAIDRLLYTASRIQEKRNCTAVFFFIIIYKYWSIELDKVVSSCLEFSLELFILYDFFILIITIIKIPFPCSDRGVKSAAFSYAVTVERNEDASILDRKWLVPVTSTSIYKLQIYLQDWWSAYTQSWTSQQQKTGIQTSEEGESACWAVTELICPVQFIYAPPLFPPSRGFKHGRVSDQESSISPSQWEW